MVYVREFSNSLSSITESVINMAFNKFIKEHPTATRNVAIISITYLLADHFGLIDAARDRLRFQVEKIVNRLYDKYHNKRGKADVIKDYTAQFSMDTLTRITGDHLVIYLRDVLTAHPTITKAAAITAILILLSDRLGLTEYIVKGLRPKVTKVVDNNYDRCKEEVQRNRKRNKNYRNDFDDDDEDYNDRKGKKKRSKGIRALKLADANFGDMAKLKDADLDNGYIDDEEFLLK